MGSILQKQVTNRVRIEAHNKGKMYVCAFGFHDEWITLKETSKGMWESDVTFGKNVKEATVVLGIEILSFKMEMLRYKIKIVIWRFGCVILIQYG